MSNGKLEITVYLDVRNHKIMMIYHVNQLKIVIRGTDVKSYSHLSFIDQDVTADA